MSSALPARRVTRTTRTALTKDNENANARPSRLSTRTKPIAAPSSDAIATGGTKSAIVGTAASRAKLTALSEKNSNMVPELAAGKRKREALGELTSQTTNRLATKGRSGDIDIKKEKFDGVVLRSKPASTRQPLRPPSRSQAENSTKPLSTKPRVRDTNDGKANRVEDDHAMAVDPPQALPSIAVRRSVVSKEVSSTTFSQRRSDPKGRTSLRSTATTRLRVEEEVDVEPVFKKRRTSSDLPEEDPAAAEEARQLAEEAAVEAKLQAEIEAYADEEEHEPDGPFWTDLDADDQDDPLMVSEYVGEIVQYMKQLEVATMPNPNYMESQKELAWKMRGILTDWLIQVHSRFRLLPETLFLCVNIIDRFLSARVVSLAKLQLVGITCMFIAAKVEEIVSPSVTHFLMCADSSYTDAEILQAERYILKTLDWNLSFPNPVHFLRRCSKADDYDVKVRTLAKYLLEISCLEWRLIAAPPSIMAGAAIWLARLTLGRENWTPNLAHYSSYPERHLISTANLMLNYILKPIRHEYFHKKYAGKRYFKSSEFMRKWALARWPEGTAVDLQGELPRIKAEIRLLRQAEEQGQEEEYPALSPVKEAVEFTR